MVLIVTEGDSPELSINVGGGTNVKYQWYFENSLIYKANSPNYIITNINIFQSGNYFCLVTDGEDSAIGPTTEIIVQKELQITTQPLNFTKTKGSYVEFIVNVTGNFPFTYQWYRYNNTPTGIEEYQINGETGPTYYKETISEIDAGGYYVIVKDSYNNPLQSNIGYLVVNPPPTIKEQSISENVNAGENKTLYVIIEGGTAPYTYQWKQNTIIKESFTYQRNDSEFELKLFNTTNVGNYYVNIRDSSLISVTSEIITLGINIFTQISKQPENTTVLEGTPANLYVETTGIVPLSYQWYKNNILIVGANDSQYTITNSNINDIGYYYVTLQIAENNYINSSIAYVNVDTIPIIINQNSNLIEKTETSYVELFVKMNVDDVNYNYQWYFNENEKIEGATSNVYSIVNLNQINEGYYYVTVTNLTNVEISSQRVFLKINPLLQVTTLSENVLNLTESDDINIQTQITGGTPPYTFKWFTRQTIGNDIYEYTTNTFQRQNANSETYYKTNLISTIDSGMYYLNVSDSSQVIVNSSFVTVNITSNFVIYNQPKTQTTIRSNAVTFSVENYGYLPYRFQWYFNNEFIPNANEPVYKINYADFNNEGYYFVKIWEGFQESGGQYYGSNSTDSTIVYLKVSQNPCFKEDSKILTNKGYVPIQYLRKGDLIKTLKHGYKPIHIISCKQITHTRRQKGYKDQLYKCNKQKYSEIFEDLIITGGHSILVDEFKNNEQKEKNSKYFNGEVYKIDGKYRLLACVDDRTSVYEKEGRYNIYHFALVNDDYNANNGVYANGLLVETCSKKFLIEESDMIKMK